jgi:heme/copper-type cytochrome/quinol oxidase subunit 3
VFLRLPFQPAAHLQQTVLILNTIILITALVVVEIAYAEVPKEKRLHLRYFYPLFVVLAGLLIFAMYKQVNVG